MTDNISKAQAHLAEAMTQLVEIDRLLKELTKK